jgi:hypothetical protein
MAQFWPTVGRVRACVLMRTCVRVGACVHVHGGARQVGFSMLPFHIFVANYFLSPHRLLRSPQFPHAPQCFHTPAMMCTQVTTSNRRTHGSFSSQRILGIQCLLRLSKRKHKFSLMPPNVQLYRNAELYEFQLVPSALGFPRIPCMNLFNSLSRAASRMDLAALPVSRAMDSDQ